MSRTDLREEAYLSIGDVSKRTGLSGRQIRYYEQKGLISPMRTEGNQRRFTEGDVKRLLRIKHLMEENSDIRAVKEILASEEQEHTDYTDTEGHPVPPYKTPDGQQPILGQVPGRHYLTSLYPISDRAQILKLLRYASAQKQLAEADKKEEE